MNFTCPVCFYPGLEFPPRDYEICPCCGVEFGNDDEIKSHAELRQAWVNRGGLWFFGAAPRYWNPWMQLTSARLYTDVSRFANAVDPNVTRLSCAPHHTTAYTIDQQTRNVAASTTIAPTVGGADKNVEVAGAEMAYVQNRATGGAQIHGNRAA
jgi:hypothetical protein